MHAQRQEADGLVYVSLAQLMALEFKARALSFVARQPHGSILSGNHASRLRGRGLNFDELRRYQPGDDLRHLDWRASLRTGKPVVRTFTEERDRPALIVVDQRMSMFFGSSRSFKSATAGAPHSHASPCVSLSVSASQGTSQGTSSGITFNELSTLYIEEHKANVEPATLRDIHSVCKTLSGAFAGLDLKGHTRADMVALKGALMVDRQGSTVNKLLTRLSTVMSWAVNNGYLDKSFDKGLKLTKDADSSRRAFSKDQVARLMVAANSLPVTDETRWAVSVGVLTGARIAEVLQLTRKDIVEVNGQWVVSINADDGKSVKTKSSLRVVPLTDEAYGFDLKDLLEFVAGSPEGNALFCSGSRSATQERLNRFIKKTLGLDKGKASLSFHSLRHSLAGALKAAEPRRNHFDHQAVHGGWSEHRSIP